MKYEIYEPPCDRKSLYGKLGQMERDVGEVVDTVHIYLKPSQVEGYELVGRM